jgi:hypothetical protein
MVSMTLASMAAIADVNAQQRRESRQRQTQAQGRSDVAPEADRILREMSRYMAGLNAFEVNADSVTEVVTENGQKLQFLASSKVKVQRPDRLRSERRGPEAVATLYYDGNSITLFDESANLWATADAPRTLDEMIVFARENLDIEAPGADLLGSDVYSTLMEDVRSGMYVGREHIDGIAVHHLAFRNRGGTDWQIWIREGAVPLPIRYVVVSTDLTSQPEFEVTLRDWDRAPQMTNADFEFEPPLGEGARQIEFLHAVERRDAARRQQQRRYRGGQ